MDRVLESHHRHIAHKRVNDGAPALTLALTLARMPIPSLDLGPDLGPDRGPDLGPDLGPGLGLGALVPEDVQELPALVVQVDLVGAVDVPKRLALRVWGWQWFEVRWRGLEGA